MLSIFKSGALSAWLLLVRISANVRYGMGVRWVGAVVRYGAAVGGYAGTVG